MGGLKAGGGIQIQLLSLKLSQIPLGSRALAPRGPGRSVFAGEMELGLGWVTMMGFGS